ncbi:uncharacterized protein J8A68_002202 [[Candida] subhashii]|uniref:Uncharacterized protein n=1 Tax=[Candida] subhashii TaxID=561895 RepID=A0A8J5QJK4_9ASCO|nr:uncharacterized protein J8A68_002202 [[Candida] subhashii]KAG7664287.1 hypothetical protein J8A68_002202 [[Candida] subhashii]
MRQKPLEETSRDFESQSVTAATVNTPITPITPRTTQKFYMDNNHKEEKKTKLPIREKISSFRTETYNIANRHTCIKVLRFKRNKSESSFEVSRVRKHVFKPGDEIENYIDLYARKETTPPPLPPPIQGFLNAAVGSVPPPPAPPPPLPTGHCTTDQLLDQLLLIERHRQRHSLWKDRN